MIKRLGTVTEPFYIHLLFFNDIGKQELDRVL